MHHINNNNGRNVVAIAVTIFTFAITAVALSMVNAPVAATTTSNIIAIPSSTITTTTPSSSSGTIALSPNPIQREQIKTTSQTPINQTHMSITYAGNGTLMLPNTTETINIKTDGSGIVSLMDQSVYGMETLRTEDGQTATATSYEIVQLDPATGAGKGITMGVIHTNSTIGSLASLNGTILIGMDDIQPNGEEAITIWEWESGIGNNSCIAPPHI